ncbi:DUF3685 domain-containing protein [Acaryochloris sp. 'Moss Beach']|uniref:DUF3685 domain-containing protein n=1 Tax=Acaryochloris sp. 'Moss Beach' TaxID=2740837 RepID=UPI001F2258E3|nr:DUF3685 domain-containing protein [Acaryochloris sp. 'Moss Beach']UJB71419.1 DUF3685 domain-containing protein [Acaryochloris sp. 'Moss Beach']
MTEQAAAQTQPLQFMLADTDPIFRVGLKACLEAVPDIQIVAEAEDPAQVLQLFSTQPEADTSPDVDPQSLDLLILDISRVADVEANGLLCQQLKRRYPHLALFVLSATVEPDQLTKLWQVGVEGFCRKGSVDTPTLIQQLRRASQGQRVWDSAQKAQAQIVQQPAATPQIATQNVTAFTLLRQVFMQTGLKQIEQTLEQLQSRRQGEALTQWQRTINEGRERELQTVSWLVRQYMERQSDDSDEEPLEPEEPAFSWANVDPWETDELTAVPSRITEISDGGDLAAQPEITTVLLDGLLAKLPTSLSNRTQDPLEIDILKAQKRQDLFLIVLKQFETVVEDLSYSQVTRSQLVSKRAKLLQDLWLGSTADFFGKYLTIPLSSSVNTQGLEDIEIVSVLQQDQAIVEAEILDKIPLVTELLDHLLFKAPLLVDNTLSAVGSPEAMLQAEALLSNLVVSVANGVLQPLLNRFATNEAIKQSFYDRSLISTRDIERFRNALSNHYRSRRLFKEPTEIFESQYGLIVFSEAGLQKIAVYGSRDQELKQLQGTRFFVTLALEGRDAIAPPLQATFTFLGRGVVYILTQVVGRGLGLIGRGILQGVGGTWQDIFVSRKSHQEK